MLWVVEEMVREAVPGSPVGETRLAVHHGGQFHAASRAEAERILGEQYAPFRGGRLRVRQAWRGR